MLHQILTSVLASAAVTFAAALFAKDASTGPVPVPLVTTAETLVAVGAPLTVQYTTVKAVISAWLTLTCGTNTTLVTVRIYRGTTAAGTLIGTAVALTVPAGPGPGFQIDMKFVDVLTSAGSAQYCMTCQQTAATANGSVTAALIETELLSG